MRSKCAADFASLLALGSRITFDAAASEMIVARVNAGLARARQNGTKSGKAIGRPRGASYEPKKIRAALLKGGTVREVARSTGASVRHHGRDPQGACRRRRAVTRPRWRDQGARLSPAQRIKRPRRSFSNVGSADAEFAGRARQPG